MKQLPSAQFRTAYARLTEPTVVTVLGRPIGAWTPVAHVRAGLGHPGDGDYALSKVDDLEDEVRRLKRELAKRAVTMMTPQGLVSGPASDTDQGWDIRAADTERAERRSKQQVIDATLAKVNRKKEKT